MRFVIAPSTRGPLGLALAPAGPARKDDPLVARSPQPRTILVIDDNVDGAQTLADILTMEGHHVSVANDGTSGVTLARSLRPDFVLCDIGLPDVDGSEVCRTLRLDLDALGRLLADAE